MLSTKRTTTSQLARLSSVEETRSLSSNHPMHRTKHSWSHSNTSQRTCVWNASSSSSLWSSGGLQWEHPTDSTQPVCWRNQFKQPCPVISWVRWKESRRAIYPLTGSMCLEKLVSGPLASAVRGWIWPPESLGPLRHSQQLRHHPCRNVKRAPLVVNLCQSCRPFGLEHNVQVL